MRYFKILLLCFFPILAFAQTEIYLDPTGNYKAAFTAYKDVGVVLLNPGEQSVVNMLRGANYIPLSIMINDKKDTLSYYKIEIKATKVTPVVTPPPAPNVFTGTYYDNKDFTGTSFSRTDNTINFNWASGSPDPRIANESFSVRWEGDFTFQSGSYTFTARADDGVRVYIDNVLAIDQWRDQGATTFTTVKTITAGTHKIKVEYYDNAALSTINVSWKLNASTGDVPSLPGEFINVTSSQNYKQLIETATKDIMLAPGTYVGPFNIPVAVDIYCDNATLTSSQTGSENSGTKIGIINLNSGSKTNGSQVITGCIFDGKNIAYAGIMSSNRDNVTVERCIIKDTNFTGVWIRDAAGAKVLNNTFENAAWADDRYMSGALMINNLTDFLIEGNTFTSNKNSKGTGIESNSLVKESTLTRGKIYNNKSRLSKHNPWGGGKSQNFFIEFHDMHLRGMDIAYNDIENEISLASHRPGNGSLTHIHHNTGNLAGNLYCVETVADDLLIEENVWSGAGMLVANYQPNGVWRNWVIRNNKLTNSVAPPWGAPILIGPNGVQNVLIENNALPTPIASAVKFMGTTGGVTIR